MKKILSLVVMIGCMTMSLPVSAKSTKKLSTDYEIVIANNTKRPLHWHLKTSGNDYNGDLEPGAVKDNLFTGNFLDRLEITFKGNGPEERRGYKVPGLQSGKDWIFSVDGEPFTGNWTVCGMWKDTAAQGAATMAGIIGGIAIATTIIVVLSAGTASGLYAAEAAAAASLTAAETAVASQAALVGAVAAAGQTSTAAAAVGMTTFFADMAAISTEVIAAEYGFSAALGYTAAVTAAEATVAGSAAAAATGAAAEIAVMTLVGAGASAVESAFAADPELAKLAQEMTHDKCEWHYNKRITLTNGSHYMMVIQDAEKSVGVLPGKTFVVRQTLLDDKIKIKAYFESSKEDLLGEKEKVKRRNVTFTHDSKGWHVAKSGTNFNDDAETESRKTTFKNESAMPVSIIRNEKMSEPVEILVAQETDAAGNKVTDEVTNEHMLSDNFRYYGYMDKPIEQEVTISWDKGDAILSLNGSAIGISYSRVRDE